MSRVATGLGAARIAADYARRERGRALFIACVFLGFIVPLIVFPATAFG